MSHAIELGIFIPVANNGWIMSKTSPQFLPTFELNCSVAENAERLGFDYLFSMAKWRGFGGATAFWDYSLEPVTLMAGLASRVSKLRLITSIAPILVHPAIFAKMFATVDDISGGRLGVNIVSAGNPGEYAQMGMYPENFEDFRYDYTEEWITIVKRLWSEDSVSFQGKYFSLDDCQSWPKPVQRNVPIVCATSSERGFRFIAEHCSDGFFGGGRDAEADRVQSRRMKEVAIRYGRAVKSHALVMVIQGDTNEEAQNMFDHYVAGADQDAIDTTVRKRTAGKSQDQQSKLRSRFVDGKAMRIFYGGIPLVGDAQRVADLIEEHAVGGEIDGMMVVFPEFVDALARFGKDVMPLLRKRGLIRENVAVSAGA